MSNIKETDLTWTEKVRNHGIAITEKDLTAIKSQPIVEQMENEWPKMTGEFKRLQREQYELFCRKQHDYGPGNISVGTQLQTPDEVKLSLTGLWFRMNDKIQRLKTLLMGNKESAVDEPLEDAYLDVSNYGIMATIVKNGKWGK
jgi:hypothetical protein